MNEFSLHELIDSVLDDAGPSAADIAAKVEPLIPEAYRHSVFMLALTRYIAQYKPRMSTITPRSSGNGSNRSAKVEAYREHARFLRLTVNVARGVDKWMADCTYDDLMYAAENRRIHAAETIAAAEEYEALAALVKRRKVTTVGQLKPDEVERFISSRRREAEAA